MDRRNDERFSLLMMAKVTLLDQPERERDYLLSEVSSTGMKLIGQELLPVGTLIGVELEKHLLLAQVRYSYMRGTSALTGAMNLNIGLKSDLNSIGPRAAQYAQLESEYKSRGPVPLPEDLGSVFPSLGKKEAVPPSSGPTISAAAVLGSIFEAQREQMDYADPPAFRERSESHADEREGALVVAEASASGNPDWTETIDPPVEAAVSEEPPLEAEPILAASPANGGRARIILTAGLVAVVAVCVFLFFSKPTDESPKPVQQVVPSTSASSAPVVPETAKVSSIAVKEPTEVPKAAPVAVAPPSQRERSTKPAGPHKAVLRVTAENWVSACSDGKPVFVKLLAAGEERTFDFSERMVLRTGNAGSAHIDINGRYIGEVGPSGGVRLIELTSSGFRLLNSRTPVKDCDVR